MLQEWFKTLVGRERNEEDFGWCHWWREGEYLGFVKSEF
jgi:hypothetical protein